MQATLGHSSVATTGGICMRGRRRAARNTWLGLEKGQLGHWALVLGGLGATAAVIAMLLNLDLDRRQNLSEGESVGYPFLTGFELEDGIYLLVPITWLGLLEPFLVAAALGATAYCLWTLFTLMRLPIGVASSAAASGGTPGTRRRRRPGRPPPPP